MAEKSSFILYHNMRDAFDLLTDSELGRLLRAIVDYSEYGREPQFDGSLRMAFAFIRSQLDRDADKWDQTRQARSEAGKKSGESRRRKNEEKQASDEQNEQSGTKRTNVNFVQQNEQSGTKRTVNVNVNANANVDVNEINNTRACGTYNNVMLTSEQISDLGNIFPEDWTKRIDALSAYMYTRGKTYADHYATIIEWARRDAEKAARAQADRERQAAQARASAASRNKSRGKPLPTAAERPPSFDIDGYNRAAFRHRPQIPKEDEHGEE